MNRMYLLVICFVFFHLFSSALGKDQPIRNALDLKELHRQGIVRVITYDSLGTPKRYGSGIMLWNYADTRNAYLLTATHVFEGGDKFCIFSGGPGSGFTSILDTLADLHDSTGRQLYLTFTRETGEKADLTLIELSRKNKATSMPDFTTLPRSYCAFDNTVFIGDKLLVLGYADVKVYDFLRKGRPLATAAVVAYKTDVSYLMDQRIHKGMSGGIVYKEYPSDGKYLYRAVGIVSACLSKDPDYSWVTKLDYIDSVLIQNTGKKWGVDQGPFQEE